MSDEAWLTKEQMLATIQRSERTLHLWVQAGRIERRMDGSRAYYRIATPGNSVTPRNDAEAPAWAVELQQEIRALREEIASLRGAQREIEPSESAAPPQLPPGDAPQQRNAPLRRSWWRRLLFLDEM